MPVYGAANGMRDISTVQVQIARAEIRQISFSISSADIKATDTCNIAAEREYHNLS